MWQNGNYVILINIYKARLIHWKKEVKAENCFEMLTSCKAP
jgi:hypothetical protein